MPGKSHGRRSLEGCSPWGRYESDTTERLHFHFFLSCIGEENGNPLQCSCLENPRDGGAWWAAVYGVAQSWTRLKRLSSSSSGENAPSRLYSPGAVIPQSGSFDPGRFASGPVTSKDVFQLGQPQNTLSQKRQAGSMSAAAHPKVCYFLGLLRPEALGSRPSPEEAQTSPTPVHTPPQSAFLEVHPPRLHNGESPRFDRPGPQTHLRPRSQQRPHDQGQRGAQPLAPAEAAASGPTISRVRSVRWVAPGNHISSSFDCSTLLIFILASTRRS